MHINTDSIGQFDDGTLHAGTTNAVLCEFYWARRFEHILLFLLLYHIIFAKVEADGRAGVRELVQCSLTITTDLAMFRWQHDGRCETMGPRVKCSTRIKMSMLVSVMSHPLDGIQ